MPVKFGQISPKIPDKFQSRKVHIFGLCFEVLTFILVEIKGTQKPDVRAGSEFSDIFTMYCRELHS